MKADLGTADLQQVDGLPADVDVVGDVPEEDGHVLLHAARDQGVPLRPEVFI